MRVRVRVRVGNFSSAFFSPHVLNGRKKKKQRPEPDERTSTSLVSGMMYSSYNLTTSSGLTLAPLSGTGSPSGPNSAPYHLAFLSNLRNKAASTAGLVIRARRAGGLGVRM